MHNKHWNLFFRRVNFFQNLGVDPLSVTPKKFHFMWYTLWEYFIRQNSEWVGIKYLFTFRPTAICVVLYCLFDLYILQSFTFEFILIFFSSHLYFFLHLKFWLSFLRFFKVSFKFNDIFFFFDWVILQSFPLRILNLVFAKWISLFGDNSSPSS